MIRKSTDGDISDEEFEQVLKPFLDDYDNFILSYIMPEVIAYYIANSYYRGSMYEGSFLQHYNSAKDLINLFGEDYEQMKAEVFKLLKIKYALIVVNEDPLEIKKIKYESLYDAKGKLFRYGCSKGFESELVLKTCDKIINESLKK